MYSRNRIYAGLAVFTIVMLAGSLGYYYSIANSQISSLRSDGRNLCTTFSNAAKSILGVLTNTTIMQRQIQQDGAITTALNSTRPLGYANMTATLQGQITQDMRIIDSINGMTTTVTPVGPGPCASFN
jgi:hypothetical protein